MSFGRPSPEALHCGRPAGRADTTVRRVGVQVMGPGSSTGSPGSLLGKEHANQCDTIPTLDDRINDIRMRTARIINEEILPHEEELWRTRRSTNVTDEDRAASESCAPRSSQVKDEGLWPPSPAGIRGMDSTSWHTPI